MNILILGVGNMGAALARRFTTAGHVVQLAATSFAKAEKVAASIAGASAVDTGQGAAAADVILVATPYEQAASALAAVGPLDDKVVIDITNPLTADYTGLTVGQSTSAAEELAKAFPTAHVVKAFNTLFAQVVSEGATFANGQTAPTFIASDSERAKSTARSLAESIGFDVIDAGPLRNARYLEPLAGLNIHFGYAAGQGTGIAPNWLQRA